MAVRDFIERYRGLSVSIAIAVITLSVGYLWWSVLGAGGSDSQKAYFSIDDGKTWFAHDATKVAPFEYDGSTAYRAYVFTCDNGKTQWVGYLERYTGAGKQVAKMPPTLPPPGGQPLVPSGHELKKPGTAQWIDAADLSKASAVMTTKCPHEANHRVLPLEPS